MFGAKYRFTHVGDLYFPYLFWLGLRGDDAFNHFPSKLCIYIYPYAWLPSAVGVHGFRRLYVSYVVSKVHKNRTRQYALL